MLKERRTLNITRPVHIVDVLFEPHYVSMRFRLWPTLKRSKTLTKTVSNAKANSSTPLPPRRVEANDPYLDVEVPLSGLKP